MTTTLELKFDKKLYATSVRPKWCPGCGDFAMLKAVKDTLFELQKDPSQTILVAGIGCSSKMSDSVGVYGFHGIHGRAVAAATGIKLANHNLDVISFGGDGDSMGIGGNHFVHACKRNMDLTMLIPNNQNYGLTTGQASPTSNVGYKTRTSPQGVFDEPISPMLMAISAGATFVARSSSADHKHLREMIKQAMQHRGMAVIEIHQFCITWNKVNTPDYYASRYFDIDPNEYDISNKNVSLKLANMDDEKIPFGVIYRKEGKSFEDNYEQLQGISIVEKRNREIVDVSGFFQDLM